MPFYIRKSLKAGPLRFNLSKSGVGVSTSIRGFRVGTGPRGNYVHIGRNGTYYRATAPYQNTINRYHPTPSHSPVSSSSTVLEEIESADILQLQDSSSADLLAELNAKKKIAPLFPLAVIIYVAAIIALITLESPIWLLLAVLIIETPALYYVWLRDKVRKTVVLFYEFEDQAEQAYQCLHNAFDELRHCATAWHVSAQGNIRTLNERKRQGGAGTLLKRNRVLLRHNAPALISTNIAIPSIPVGNQTLYLFPDRILITEGGKVGAVAYTEAQITIGQTRFIENGMVPKDTQQVGETWQYTNRGGGPDRRFKNNRKIPIVLYREIHFTSGSGLNELIQVSNPHVGHSLVEAFGRLASVLITL